MKHKTVITLVLAILALSISYASYADESVTWSWTEVTQDVFDNPITVDEYIFKCNNSPDKIFPTSQLSHVETLTPGIHACNIIVGVNGQYSEISNTVVKIVDGEPPEILQPKPSVLSVTTN